MVMVGADLSVRRFTPQAATVLGLMASDIGRPIPRLKLKIDGSNLEQMMLDVIQEVQARHYRVQDHEGRWCALRITPYRTMDNRIEGVVLTVLDSSAIAEATIPANARQQIRTIAKKGKAKRTSGNRKGRKIR
jgi:two-component system CheB/CheR fusion protein